MYCSAVFLSCFITAGTEDLDLGKRAGHLRATFRSSSLKLYAQLLSVKCFILHHHFMSYVVQDADVGFRPLLHYFRMHLFPHAFIML